MNRDNARWSKSSYSGGSGTECVEIAVLNRRVRVRDSKDPGRSRLDFAIGTWGEFAASLRQSGGEEAGAHGRLEA
ncbi:DUF397 domain-containing protein [Streptomyces sp. NPDC059134]|uniref:DUF397 domain-containing protein n=1 Tax=Streptomyces sp. NPDC059134 TaxID=3346738 RepID=UPI003674B077